MILIYGHMVHIFFFKPSKDIRETLRMLSTHFSVTRFQLSGGLLWSHRQFAELLEQLGLCLP